MAAHQSTLMVPDTPLSPASRLLQDWRCAAFVAALLNTIEGSLITV